MNYQEIKALIAKMFQVNTDDFNTIMDIIDHAEEAAMTKEYDGKGVSPLAEYRMILASAAKYLAKYVDQ